MLNFKILIILFFLINFCSFSKSRIMVADLSEGGLDRALRLKSYSFLSSKETGSFSKKFHEYLNITNNSNNDLHIFYDKTIKFDLIQQIINNHS